MVVPFLVDDGFSTHRQAHKAPARTAQGQQRRVSQLFRTIQGVRVRQGVLSRRCDSGSQAETVRATGTMQRYTQYTL